VPFTRFWLGLSLLPGAACDFSWPRERAAFAFDPLPFCVVPFSHSSICARRPTLSLFVGKLRQALRLRSLFSIGRIELCPPLFLQLDLMGFFPIQSPSTFGFCPPLVTVSVVHPQSSPLGSVKHVFSCQPTAFLFLGSSGRLAWPSRRFDAPFFFLPLGPALFMCFSFCPFLTLPRSTSGRRRGLFGSDSNWT